MEGLRGRPQAPAWRIYTAGSIEARIDRNPLAGRDIPKADGKQRPLADRRPGRQNRVQGATVILLNAIYEGDFCGFSYGFRP